MKKIIPLFLLFILSSFLSVSVHAAGVAVGCGFTSDIGSPIDRGFDNSGSGSKYKAFKHKDGVCMDLGTQRNLCELELTLASNATQTVVIHVTFFSDIDASTGRGKAGTEIHTLRQRHSINKSPTTYSTWNLACASTSVETAQAYTNAIKNVRCVEIVHQYDSAGDYVNLYKVTPYRRYTGNESSGRYIVNFSAASANSPLPTVDGNTITFRYRDVNEFLCYVAGGKPLGTSSGLATYYTLSGNSISVEFLTKNNADYMKLRAINTGTSTLTLHRKEAWHFEATSTTYTIVVERRPISYDGIEATYTKKLTYGGNYKNTNISLTDSHGSSYFGTTTLEKDTHYTVELSDNFYPGTMKIKITGMGLYSGSRTYSVTIVPRTLTLEAVADEKEYDGTTVGTGAITATNIVDGDDVSISANFTFAQKNVGKNIPVTANQFVLSGEHAHCYAIEDTQLGAVADIIPRPVKASLSADDKTYDGTIAATGTFSLDDVVSGDSVTVSAASVTFDNKNVGTGKLVTAAGLTLNNTNYALFGTTATDTANIIACILAPSFVAKDKTYDGNTDATGTLSIDGIVPGDSVTLSASSITFADKNVGSDKIVTAAGLSLDNANYTLSSDSVTSTANITAKTIYPHVTADSKTYDATTDIHNGTLYLDGIIGADIVELQAESFAFDSPLPGERNAVAEKLYLIGTDKDNYTLSTDTCTMPAMISPYELTHVTCVSQYINTAMAQLMQGDIQKALPFTLPANCTYHYSSGTFGTVTTDYVRVADYTNALGKITDTMIFDIQVDDITIVFGNISVTTGTRTVYGNNQFTTPHGTMTSSILRFDDTWTKADNNKVYIETNTPTDVTFKVYLYQGEKLNVGTDIGLYHGRVDVTIKKGESEQAIDKIDAFFPVSYEEEYTISNMHSSRVQNEINPNRNDYWSAVPEFTASEDGLYNVTMHVTGTSYLLDSQKGLGTMYQGNDPADPPETSLRYIAIQ